MGRAVFYRARYFDANTGRFLSEDPIRFRAGDQNFFRYVGNNPINVEDPFGRKGGGTSSGGGSGKGGTGKSGEGSDFLDTSTLNIDLPDITGDSALDMMKDESVGGLQEEVTGEIMNDLFNIETSPLQNESFLKKGGRENAQKMMDFFKKMGAGCEKPAEQGAFDNQMINEVEQSIFGSGGFSN